MEVGRLTCHRLFLGGASIHTGSPTPGSSGPRTCSGPVGPWLPSSCHTSQLKHSASYSWYHTTSTVGIASYKSQLPTQCQLQLVSCHLYCWHSIIQVSAANSVNYSWYHATCTVGIASYKSQLPTQCQLQSVSCRLYCWHSAIQVSAPNRVTVTVGIMPPLLLA